MNKKELFELKKEILGVKSDKEEIIGKVLKEVKEVLGWELSDKDISSLVPFLNEEISKFGIEEDRLEIGGVKRDRVVFCPLFNHVED